MRQSAGSSRRAAAFVLCLALVVATASVGCTSTSAPRIDVKPVAPSIVTSMPTEPWAVGHAGLLETRIADFEAAISYLGDNLDSGGYWNPLPESLKSLSRYGQVLVMAAEAPWPEDGDVVDLALFDTGDSDYPCVEGLIYSASPDVLPQYGGLFLGAPYRIAPHWWVGRWQVHDYLPSPAGHVPLIDGYPDGGAIDREFSDTDARRIDGPAQSVEGTVVADFASASYSREVVWIDTGSGKPMSVVINKWTDFGESSWRLLKYGHPTVRINARVKAKWLPVNGVRQAFAIEARVMKP